MNESFVSDFGISIVAALLVVAATSVCLNLFWPAVRKLIAEHEPRRHARAILMYSALPFAAGTTLLIACLAVSMSAGFDVVPAHCHADISGRSCTPHAPLDAAALSPAAVLMIAGIAMFAILLGVFRRISGHRRTCRNLLYCADFSSELGAYVVESEQPFVFCAGLLRPQIFVSTALIGKTDERELRIVLDHERHHAKRGHGAVLFLVHFMTSTLLPSVRREMLAAFHLAIEHSCDRFAAVQCGDRIAVASTLLKLKRMILGHEKECLSGGDALALSIYGSSLARRVDWLLDSPKETENRIDNVLGHVVCYAMLATILLAELAHLLLETAIIRLFG